MSGWKKYDFSLAASLVDLARHREKEKERERVPLKERGERERECCVHKWRHIQKAEPDELLLKKEHCSDTRVTSASQRAAR